MQSALCKELLKGSGVHVGAAISFPLGQTTIETKVFETRDALANGADEIDYVINITELKAKNYGYIREEMRRIVEVCREAGAISKVIFETAISPTRKSGSSARSPWRSGLISSKPPRVRNGRATLEDVRLMKGIVGDAVKVKAAGGIRDLKTCLAMVEAGAERIRHLRFR